MKINYNDILFYLSLLFSIWFAFAGIVWTYGAAIFIAYPFGLISLLIWLTLKNDNKKRTKWIPRILITGLVLSLSILALFLIYD